MEGPAGDVEFVMEIPGRELGARIHDDRILLRRVADEAEGQSREVMIWVLQNATKEVANRDDELGRGDAELEDDLERKGVRQRGTGNKEKYEVTDLGRASVKSWVRGARTSQDEGCSGVGER